jgi:hypothetical protein
MEIKMTSSPRTTAKPKPNPGPLPFAMHGSETSGRYGDYYWAIGLPDGREVFVLADRVEVSGTGALMCWQDQHTTTDGSKEPRDTPMPTLGIAAGQWTCFYAASVLGGDPVAIDSLVAPR